MGEDDRRLLREYVASAKSDLTLTYSLTSEERDCNGPEPVKMYAISVSACCGSNREESCIEDVSRDCEEAGRIFDIISENLVTPETLEYILEEIISFGIQA